MESHSNTYRKRCPSCKQIKAAGDFDWRLAKNGRRYAQPYCKPCRRVYSNKMHAKHAEKRNAARRGTGASTLHARARRLRVRGLDVSAYERLLTQQRGVCAICGRGPSGRFGVLCVDHDHATSKVRGLLCSRCNTGIGQFMDDAGLLAKATRYLRKHKR